MSELVVQGGRVLDETGERVADVRVVDGSIAEVGGGLAPSAGALVLDAEGCVVAPGLVDIQVHFRTRAAKTRRPSKRVPAPRRSAVAPR